MKKGKAQGPDDIPVEAWIALSNKGLFIHAFIHSFIYFLFSIIIKQFNTKIINIKKKGVEFLVKFFNRLLRGEKMPDEWRRSVLVPLYKGKGASRNVETTGGSS